MKDSPRACADAGAFPWRGSVTTGYVAGFSGARPLFFEAGDCGGLVLVDVEDGQQLGDGEQVPDLPRQVEELQLPALAPEGGEAGDEFADAARVHVADLRQVQEDLLPAPLGQSPDRAAQRDVALADRDLAAEIEHGHVAGLPLGNLHVGHRSKPPSGVDWRVNADLLTGTSAGAF